MQSFPVALALLPALAQHFQNKSENEHDEPPTGQKECLLMKS